MKTAQPENSLQPENSPQLEKISQGHYRLTGSLTFNSVPELWAEHKDDLFTEQSDVLDIDCSQLVHSDSSGLALLVEWCREAGRQNKNITFFNLPEPMYHIAEICSLDEILPLSKKE